MKDKNVAAILAFFTGTFGIHRFYLGQVGLGVLYCVFFWTGITSILGLVDAIALLTMDKDRFDYKYNRDFFERSRSGRYDQGGERYERYDDRRPDLREQRRREREERYERRRREREERYQRRRRESERPVRPEYRRPEARQRSNPRPAQPSPQAAKTNVHKRNGIRLFKEYDYDGSIEAFNKGLQMEPKDVASHFNLACAYSLTEQKEKAFFHLDKAVEYGFVDYDKLNTHDALAYVRIQEEWDPFVENGYQIAKAAEPKEAEQSTEQTQAEVDPNTDLLEQIKQLGELREKGFLTEEEFATQKRRLLG